VVGDVNATLDHAPLRAALTGARDVAADCGQGLVATWPARLPRWMGVQIDHVFTSGGPRPLNFRVLDLPGSDHRALLAQVVVPAPPKIRHRRSERATRHTAVHDNLPDGSTLRGDQFIVPGPTPKDAVDTIHDVLDEIDFWGMSQLYDNGE
jgi:hypothetical protein